jgi:ElaB/YqjD/DUF883 family membrane-anchored ribosome-binding protein
MAQEPEAIRQQMSETRAALSEKLETLEHQVVDTVHGATTAVNDTVTNVKEAVDCTVQTVKDSFRESVQCVKDALDIPEQVQRHPWLMLGGAVACGYLGGRLLLSDSDNQESDCSSRNGTAQNGSAATYPWMTPAHTQPAASEPRPPRHSWLTSLARSLEPELSELKGLAIGSVFALMRDLVKESAPRNMAPSLGEIADKITLKLGGTPIAGPLLRPQGDACPPGEWGESIDGAAGLAPAQEAHQGAAI